MKVKMLEKRRNKLKQIKKLLKKQLPLPKNWLMPKKLKKQLPKTLKLLKMLTKRNLLMILKQP